MYISTIAIVCMEHYKIDISLDYYGYHYKYRIYVCYFEQEEHEKHLALREYAKLLAQKIFAGTFNVSMRVPIEGPHECMSEYSKTILQHELT